MKSIWSGTIGFGLVNIPVNMYSATQASELDLDMLDKKDHANIHFQRVNADTGKVVDWKNIVKGYKYNDRYVVLSDEDFEAASAKKSKVIDIVEFVDEEQVSPMYYETPYYLEPTKGGEKAYILLRDALAKTKKVGIGTYVLRSKESLALIKPYKDIIVLNKIRFPEEIRDYKKLHIPAESKNRAKELDVAVMLIKKQSGKFNIGDYHDTYSEELMKLIKAKSKGVKIKVPKMKVVHSKKEDDLMAQLKASLGAKKKKAS